MFPKGVSQAILPVAQVGVIGQYQDQYEINYTLGNIQTNGSVTLSFLENGVVIDTQVVGPYYVMTSVPITYRRCGTYLQGALITVRVEADGYRTDSASSSADYLRAESGDVVFNTATGFLAALRNGGINKYEWDLDIAPGCSDQYYNSSLTLNFDSRPTSGSWGANAVARVLSIPPDPGDFGFSYEDGPLNTFPDEVRCDVTLVAAGYTFSHTFITGVAP